MNFGELHSKVKSNAFPDGLPSNLATQFRNACVDALIKAQKYCKTVEDEDERYYQEAHIDFFEQCSIYFNCGMSVVPAPNGKVTGVFTVQTDRQCCRVDYYPLPNFAELRQWTALWAPSWTEPPNVGMPALPPGFKYSETSLDKSCGRAGFGHFTIHNRKIFVSPRVNSDEIIGVEWSGIKEAWNDSDVVTEEEDRQLERFVEMFASFELYSRFFQDIQQAQIFRQLEHDAFAELIDSVQEKLVARQTKIQSPSPRVVGGLCACVAPECRTTTDADFGGELAAEGERVIGFTTDVHYDESPTDQSAVEELIHGWDPAAVILGGDVRDTGSYHDMFDDLLEYAALLDRDDASLNRLWPVLGNHDWHNAGQLLEWYSWFKMLPNNQRFYDFVVGAAHFFSLSGDASEPEGITASSAQAEWLRLKLAASRARWKIVLLHQPPYSSVAGIGSLTYNWPFKLWGAHLLMTGHAHAYERLLVANLPIITCGLGGASPLDTFGAPVAGSQYRYNSAHGAVRLVAGCSRLVCEFYPVGATDPLDTLTLT